MQIRRTALYLLAALAIMGSAAAPFASAADQNEDTADLTATLNEGGVFALSLSIEVGGNITRPTSAIQPASGPFNVQMRMYLTDTMSYRNAFDLWLNATPYTSNLQVPLEPTGTFYQFPDNALKVYSTRHPRPGRCDHVVTQNPNECAGTPQASFTTPFPIGNLWALTQDGTLVTPAHPLGGQQADVWENANSLDAPRRVMHADAGAGTLNSKSGGDYANDHSRRYAGRDVHLDSCCDGDPYSGSVENEFVHRPVISSNARNRPVRATKARFLSAIGMTGWATRNDGVCDRHGRA